LYSRKYRVSEFVARKKPTGMDMNKVLSSDYSPSNVDQVRLKVYEINRLLNGYLYYICISQIECDASKYNHKDVIFAMVDSSMKTSLVTLSNVSAGLLLLVFITIIPEDNENVFIVMSSLITLPVAIV
jgi:hypothetical protein